MIYIIVTDLKYDLILATLSLLLVLAGIANARLKAKNKALKLKLYLANENFLDMGKVLDESVNREVEAMKLLQDSIAMNQVLHAALEENSKAMADMKELQEQNKRLSQKINDMNQLHYN